MFRQLSNLVGYEEKSELDGVNSFLNALHPYRDFPEVAEHFTSLLQLKRRVQPDFDPVRTTAA